MSSSFRLTAAWIGIVLLLMALAAILVAASPLFAWERRLLDMPSRALTAGLVVAGVIYLGVWPLIQATLRAPADVARRALIVVICGGAGLRLLLLASTPAFEDDWHRYLWDGAVTAHGLNPYAIAPEDARDLDLDASPLPALAEAAGTVVERINHPHLKTIYPPVAQAAFALAHVLQPFSLTAWRLVCLTAEGATLVLLLALLARAGRSPLWVALYWLNPVVAKELLNSAHMEAIVTPLVLAALLLAITGRHLLSITALGFAIGAKLWPVMLAPILLRPLLSDRSRLTAGLLILGGLTVSWALPPWLGGIDETSGFAAYATHWQTANALFPLLSGLAGWMLAPLGLSETTSGLVVRAGLAGLVIATAVWQAVRPIATAEDLLRRAGLVTLVMLLASPAQFPWYLIWALPLMTVQPLLGLAIASLTMPLYYIGFHYLAAEQYWIFRRIWVWVIWLPVWAALLLDVRRGRLRLEPRSTTESG